MGNGATWNRQLNAANEKLELRRVFRTLPLLLILCVPRHRFSDLALLPQS